MIYMTVISYSMQEIPHCSCTHTYIKVYIKLDNTEDTQYTQEMNIGYNQYKLCIIVLSCKQNTHNADRKVEISL